MTDSVKNPKDALYFYKAVVISVYDGDTITVNIDLSMGIWVYKEKLRLYRINTPEVRGEEKRVKGRSLGVFSVLSLPRENRSSFQR